MKKLNFIFSPFLIGLIFVYRVSNADFYTSVEHLVDLVDKVSDLITSLDYFLMDNGGELTRFDANEFHRHLNDYHHLVREANKDPRKFIGNPINALLLIKKFTRDLEKVLQVDTYPAGQSFLSYLRARHEPLPDLSDYHGSILGILRLQTFYSINLRSLIAGKLTNKSSEFDAYRELAMDELIDIVHYAVDSFDYYHAAMFLNETLELAQVNQERLSEFKAQKPLVLNATTALINLSFNLSQPDYGQHLMFTLKQLLSMINDTHDFTLLVESANNLTNASISSTNVFSREHFLKSNTDFDEQFMSLCAHRATSYANCQNVSKLHCAYARHHPLLLISPIKYELINLNPPLFIYYDIISERQAHEFKNQSLPKVKLAIFCLIYLDYQKIVLKLISF